MCLWWYIWCFNDTFPTFSNFLTVWRFKGVFSSINNQTSVSLHPLGRHGEPKGYQRRRQTGRSVWILVTVIRQRDPVSPGELVYCGTPPLSRLMRSALRFRKNPVLLVWRIQTELYTKTSLSKSITRSQIYQSSFTPSTLSGMIDKLDCEVWSRVFAFQWLMKWPKLRSCALLNSLNTSCQSGSLGGSL